MKALVTGRSQRRLATDNALSARNPATSPSSRLRSRRHRRLRTGRVRASVRDDANRLDDDRLERHVLVVSARAGRGRSDLVDDVHAGGHMGKHCVAGIAATRVEEGVVLEIDKELRSGAVGLLVRAIARLPRRLRSPFVPSFLIGARVCFCFRSAVMPPPWIMKSGITR